MAVTRGERKRPRPEAEGDGCLEPEALAQPKQELSSNEERPALAQVSTGRVWAAALFACVIMHRDVSESGL